MDRSHATKEQQSPMRRRHGRVAIMPGDQVCAADLAARAGLMFWFMQKKLVGSYFSFNAASFSYFLP